MHDTCYTMSEFPPGHYYDSKTGEFHRYYNPQWWDEESYMPAATAASKGPDDVPAEVLKQLREGIFI